MDKESKILLGLFVGMGIFLTMVIAITFSGTEKQIKKEGHYAEYTCPHCHSKETHGFTTFWYNNGMICTGSKEYGKTHADYTIMSCDNCGSTWKLYLRG